MRKETETQSGVKFMNCPARLDDPASARCGLPAEVLLQYTVGSTSGSVDSVTILCPRGHRFNGPVEFLGGENGGRRNPGGSAGA